jgi:hypothetical protein
MTGADFITPDDPPEVPDSWLWERIRNYRNAMLAAFDWTQVADAPVDAAAWAEYRQALRDIPESEDDPREVVFPVEPS